ncbi:LysR family transcriptional regulator [Motiliproteus coralliicola]|uniref:LysR family transcriptional regulator n=1 Tax=Motiliproteus coralliicola TaxID=2283196 RepID=A0A369WTU8_9GAMM|nr:LysR substrate-binding domain-containing protein [Motiliproteus coralliicola]RDE22925.1 LysR family transcriptional regulator [Motiliproteus coralliicola]
MELQALRTFLAVVDEGGVQAASKALHTVQSNVTSRIKRLEQELDTELFYRQGRGLALSPSGKELVKHARQLLQLENAASMAVRQVGEQTGELRIGTMETFASFRLPGALKQLRQKHPGVQLRIESETSAALLDRLLAHKIDCAFVGGAVDHPELLATQVLIEELVLVHGKGIRTEEPALILFREGCVYRDRALTWQRQSGFAGGRVMELGTLDGIIGCVSIGLGSTLMPRWVVEQSRYSDELVVEPIESSIARVPTMMVRHRLGSALGALETLQQVVAAQANAA